MKSLVRIGKFLMALLLLLALQAPAWAETQITWYGHAAFKITTPTGKVLLIDPWLTNPLNKSGKEDLASLSKVDLILLTHGHSDHVGNAVEIAKKTGAKLVTTFDLGDAMAQYAGYPKDQMGFDTMGNMGGVLTLLDGEVRIAFIPALHGSGIEAAPGTPFAGLQQYGGNPVGLLIMIKNGPTIYHTGDTDVFSDMSLVSQFHKVDVMLAAIGDHFTMGPERAALAVKLVNPGTVIPMHYGTFPVLTGTPEDFAKALKKQKVRSKLRVLAVGETLKL